MSSCKTRPSAHKHHRRGSMIVSANRRGSQAELVMLDEKERVPTGALVADLMEKAGAGWYQAVVLPSLLGVTVVECGQIQLISSIVAALQVEWGLSEYQKAMLPSLSFFGLAIGTMASGFLSDGVGRRQTVILGFMAAAVTSLLLAIAASFSQMALFTFANGIASGIGVTGAMVMITELCPRALRATAFVLPLLAQAVGEVYAVCMTEMFMPDLVHGNWRAAVVSGAVPAYIFLCVSYFFLRESPYWLVVKGRVLDARTEILEIARKNGTTQNVEVLAQSLNTGVSAEAPDTKPKGTAEVLAKALSSKSFVFTAASFAYLCFLGQLLTMGMSYFWPQLLESAESGDLYLNPATALGLIRSFGIPSAIIMIPVMRSQVGHRYIIGISGVLLAMTLYSCAWVLAHAPGASLIPVACMSLAFSNLFYATSLLFMTESYPTAVRAVMAALSVSFGRLGAICGPILVESVGFKGFLALTCVLSMSALPLLLFLAETKGRQLEDFLEDDQEDSPEDGPVEAMPSDSCSETGKRTKV